MYGQKILMHKKDKVAALSFNKYGYLNNLKEVYNEKLLPPGITGSSEAEIRAGLERWCISRSLSENRIDIAPYREFYGHKTFISDNGISLFDCYWFADGNNKDWDKENAYDNWNPKEDILYTMIAHPEDIRYILYKKDSKNTPNYTIPGSLSRMWYYKKSKNGAKIPVILFGDAKKEMMMYNLGRDSGVIAERKYIILAGRIYAMVAAQTNKNIELISFDNYYANSAEEGKEKLENFEITCKKWHIPNWEEFLHNVLDVDNLVESKNNPGVTPVGHIHDFADFGVLRDSNTLEIIGFAKM